jgi:acetylornithine/succinyldiaminopimelate/putrescine aminotransferase
LSALRHPTDAAVLATIADRNRRQLPTFISSSLPIVVEAAQAAFLLNTYINRGVQHSCGGNAYRTVFCNSTLEAVHGAIKLARALAHSRDGRSTGQILICDGSDRLAPHFDPLGKGADAALVPGVHFVTSQREAIERIETSGQLAPAAWTAVIAGGDLAWPLSDIKDIAERCNERGITFVLDTTSRDAHSLDATYDAVGRQPDLFLWGEALTGHQVPFGAFSATRRVYQPWTTIAGFLKHSSTYAGNGLAMSVMIRTAREGFGWAARFPEIDARLAAIAATPKAWRRAFEELINPLLLYYFDFICLDGVVERASGSTLFVHGNNGRRFNLIDAIGANGSALRGHNPEDIVPDVVDTHDHTRDYWHDLADDLTARTGYERAFPAVSGASAVEIALTVAMLASEPKDTILTFKGNYGGKTLLALAVTRTSKVQEGFGPLYAKVVEIDPRATQAGDLLRRALRSGKVGLVWFELIQGMTMYPIPAALLSVIEEHRQEMGYLVGFDEVYLGMHRTGPIMQAPQGLGRADVVTFSKGLSDMTFPMAATMASAPVVAKARDRSPALVERLQVLYRSQVGAHIALHALRKIDELGLAGRVEASGARLQARLADAVTDSPLIEKVAGRGLATTLTMANTDAALLVARLAREQGGVLLNGARLTPPLTVSDDELDQIVAAIALRPALTSGLRRKLDRLRTVRWYLRGKLKAARGG